MTLLYRGKNSYFLGASAELVDVSRDTASGWASKHIFQNDAIKWVIAKYVEADNPNSNGQSWSLEDLRMAQPSINYAPMNMLHKSNHIVGAYVANEMIYPTVDDDNESAEEAANPYIETVGAFWRYYFPDELAAIESAYKEGTLYQSMECVAKSITFESPDGETAEFDYMGPFHESYGAWNEKAGTIRHLNQPHFLGGALIIPPTLPGWKGATVKDLSEFVKSHEDLAADTYASIASEQPHLDSKKVEEITLALLNRYSQIDGNSIKDNEMSKLDNTGSKGLPTISPHGGDMSDKTYTEDDLKAAVAEALAPVQAELDQLRLKDKASETDAAIEQVKAEYTSTIEDLQRQLDEEAIKAESARNELANVVSYLEAEVNAEAERAEFEARRAARIEAVNEVAEFPEDRLEASADRWAKMSDEEFASLLEDFAAAAAPSKKGKKMDEQDEKDKDKAGLESTGFKPSETASLSDKSLRREVLGFRNAGIDPTRI